MPHRAETLADMNSWANKVRAVKAISKMLRSAQEPETAWLSVLEITDQINTQCLNQLAPSADIHTVVERLHAIWQDEPPPDNLTFFYFGLVDLWNEHEQREKAGFYIAGGSDKDARQAITSGGISYLPQRRWLSTKLLNDIKQAERKIPDLREFLDYAVMLGAAGIIAKFAIRELKLKQQTYLGFDSGDFELIDDPAT